MPISLIHARRLCRKLLAGIVDRPGSAEIEATMEALMRRPRNLAEAEEWVRDILADQGGFPTPGELHRRAQRGKEGRGKKATVGCRNCNWTGWRTYADGAVPCSCRGPVAPDTDRKSESTGARP